MESLGTVTFASPRSLPLTIADSAFRAGDSLKSITIPTTVTSIGRSAFQSSNALKTVTFATPSSLLTIGDYAFSYAASLAAITIPASVTSIGSGAFEGSARLGTVTFASPRSLPLTIGNWAFASTALEAITIPANVTSIGSDTFSDAHGLNTITFLGSIDGGLDNGIIYLTTLVRDGYTFHGWYTNANFDSSSRIDDNSFYSVSAAGTLYAKWTMNPAKAEALVKPKVTGTVKVSKTLTARKGTWSGSPTPTYSYQWYACSKQVASARATVPSNCKKISGATKSTLQLAKAQKGQYISVAVIGKSKETTATTWLSKSTGKVK